MDGEKRFTYSEFSSRVGRLSHALLELGVAQGSKVAVLCPNTHPMLEAFFGICQLGAIIVPINIRLQPEEIAYILDHSESEVLIVDSEWGHVVEPILRGRSGLRHVIQIASHDSPLDACDYEALLERASDDPIETHIDEDQPISINYTSGTTSRPKGVVLTHRNSYLNAADFLFHLRVAHDDVYLHTLPLFHVNGWGGVWAITAVGGTHICLRKVDPAVILRLYVNEGVTLACAAPTVLNMILQHPDVEHVRLNRRTRMATAGSPPPAAVIEKAEKFLQMEILHVYGLTETSPFITYCEWTQAHERLQGDARARAKARKGVEMVFAGEVKVVREDGQEVAWNGQEVGEIVARGNVVMDGYYKNPDETAKVIRDGWFHTGDLAVVHPDGHIEIVDRLKDIIISGGENVSSVEVEGVLYEHPDVIEAGVVSRPDDQWGEVPVAFVVKKLGEVLTEEELRAFCRARLAHFKVPKAFYFVDQLPRTATGKLQKFKLREMLWAGMEKRVH
ncbi:AMP-dependent synthetase and ligase [Alicyclobacillus acidocaldarius subsp. acidocaldarius Tc-4-1]|uniref:AMP-dependent synthetase and ligase n=1 Tax=Alicyclobacillus acidocaldarius (strain Tc-4-1) TaxID=1048834 RepID=F8IJJ8_ALIAT|nr:AMP-dependent synthetase and ligase [Alicyclobacillus acidocaldarius subsp. acidocaldarius Tc-4-1]